MCVRPAGDAGLLAVLVEGEPELGGDDDVVAHRLQRLADQLLVVEGAVDLGGVEEGDAAVDRGAEERDHLVARRSRAERLAHAHAAEAEGGDLEALRAECAFAHCSSPVVGSARGRYVSRMTRGWHLTRAYAALLLVTSLGGLAVASPASAAPVDVTPNVARLPAGAAPAIPYVQWPKRMIVDGNRRVSISGIKGRVYALYKVDGGYLLRRDVPGPPDNDVVFVSSRGERRVLVSDVMDNSVALVVSSGGDNVMVNVSPAGQSHDSYGETRVYALPSGQLLVRKHFAGFVALEAFGVNRALLEFWDQATRDYSVIWWTPATDTVDLMSQGTTAPGLDAVDLTAWDWSFRRPGDWGLDPLHVRASRRTPPRTGMSRGMRPTCSRGHPTTRGSSARSSGTATTATRTSTASMAPRRSPQALPSATRRRRKPLGRATAACSCAPGWPRTAPAHPVHARRQLLARRSSLQRLPWRDHPGHASQLTGPHR